MRLYWVRRAAGMCGMRFNWDVDTLLPVLFCRGSNSGQFTVKKNALYMCIYIINNKGLHILTLLEKLGDFHIAGIAISSLNKNKRQRKNKKLYFASVMGRVKEEEVMGVIVVKFHCNMFCMISKNTPPPLTKLQKQTKKDIIFFLHKENEQKFVCKMLYSHNCIVLFQV